MTYKIIFWSNHLDICLNEILPPDVTSSIEILEAVSFDQLVQDIEQYPHVDMVLTSMQPDDIEALYNLQKLKRARPGLPLVALLEESLSETCALENVCNFLLCRINQSESLHADSRPSSSMASRNLELANKNEKLATDKKCHLTPRQLDVLELITQGKSNKEIARIFDLSEGTVKIHCMAIFKELGVTNRTQAALRAGQMFSGTRELRSAVC